MGAVADRERWAGRFLRAGLAGQIMAHVAAGILALGLLFGTGEARAAKLVAINGAEPAGHGRIVLTFDRAVAVKAKLAGSVLVLSYGEPSAAAPEKLAEEMPGYVSTVRRDPDGTGLRVALQRPYRINVQDAGERVFVDLLSEGWTGLPPPLPPEIVAELARRAQAAEAALRARMPPPVRRPLALELATLPTLMRLTLRLPPGTPSETSADGPATRLRVSGPWTIDSAETRGRIRPALGRLATEADESSASLVLTPAEGYAVTAEREDDTIILDIVRKAVPPPKPEAEAKIAAPAAAGPDAGAKPRAPEPPTPPPVEAMAPMPERPSGSGLVFPFRSLPPAALFERGGVATLVFETVEPVTLPTAGQAGLRGLGEPRRVGPMTVVRVAVPPGRLIDLVPVRAGTSPAWELSAGDAVSPSDTLVATRRPDGAGRDGVAIDLKQPGSAAWLDIDGERVAVVTTSARRPAGIAKRQRFVDFELLPSRLGLAVRADADDLTVRPDLDGVVIGRDGGLAVSSVANRPEIALAEPGALAVAREAWDEARLGDVRETLRQRFAAAAAATTGLRGPLRLTFARALLANGYDPEALAVLDAAGADDPLLAGQHDTAILRGLAQTRLNRTEEARRTLGTPALKADPEAALWRAVADAQDGNWREAESGFLKTLALADRYPNGLAALVRTTAAEAAIETGDAQGAMDRIARAGNQELPPLLRDRLSLVKARVEEATGATAVAIETYDRLADAAERPVAAAAAVRGALLAQGTGRLKTAEAIDRLERLSITWHGGATEDAITAGLARLYVEAGRWRDAFAATRRANGAAPKSPTSLTLTNEAQALFDDLYLTARGDGVTGIEAVALYFDFKEFAPIGRRGDEVVRRLVDRLVGLDLLDSAADLLQHQVDHRLTGAARASVAARLATVRLMDGKPLMALEAIDATYLPELSGDLRRARSLIRARALSDLSRTDLALETIDGEAGSDVERLRADIFWGARRWREAGEAHEALLGDAWRGGRPLDDAARADVIRAGLAYDLAGDAIGLERLKAKFSGPMAEGADARTFALITAANATRQPGFREIAQRATSAETLAAFLAEYRRRYPDAAVPDRGKTTQDAGQARADAPAPPPG